MIVRGHWDFSSNQRFHIGIKLLSLTELKSEYANKFSNDCTKIALELTDSGKKQEY